MAEYRLPFPEAVEEKVVRPTGEYAHENFTGTRYAIDFILDIDTPILAARDGEVIAIKSDSDRYGLDASLAGEVNQVTLDHRDGIYTEYLHLGKDQVVVEKGQVVKAGELLGYSGLSGCMSHPHLCFNAARIENGKVISMPVEFTKAASE